MGVPLRGVGTWLQDDAGRRWGRMGAAAAEEGEGGGGEEGDVDGGEGEIVECGVQVRGPAWPGTGPARRVGEARRVVL